MTERYDVREQVARQCEAVAHLARVLAEVHKDYAALIRSGQLDMLLESTGQETARQMELFGDMLNGMDAVVPDDAWLAPIFEQAHRLWPAAGRGVTGV